MYACLRVSIEMKNYTIGKSRLDTLRRLRSRPDFMERDMVAPSWEVRDREQRLVRRNRRMLSCSPVVVVGSVDSLRDLRSELLGDDVSFSITFFLVIGLVLMFVVALSPWGVLPPTTGGR